MKQPHAQIPVMDKPMPETFARAEKRPIGEMPATLAELIEYAIRAGHGLILDQRYRPDSNSWHFPNPTTGFCHADICGAVMRHVQLPPDPRRYWILRDDEYHGWNQRLWTLERISRCEWREAYSIFHRTPLFNLEWDIHEVLEALEQTRFFEPPPQYPRLQYFPPAYLGLEQFSAALEALQSAYELLQEAGL